MRPAVGVVCTGGAPTVEASGRCRAASYVLCDAGRITWLEDADERSEEAEGPGVLVAVAEGEADALDEAVVAAVAAMRAASRLWSGTRELPSTELLSEFLLDAHTRMHWKARSRGARLGASLALLWIVDRQALWAQVGTARLFLARGGRLARVSRPWPEADAQRLVGGSLGLGDDAALHFREGHNVGRLDLREGDRLVGVTASLGDLLAPLGDGSLVETPPTAQAAAVALLGALRSHDGRAAGTAVVVDLGSAAARARVPEVREEVPPSKQGPPRDAAGLRLDPPPRRRED